MSEFLGRFQEDPDLGDDRRVWRTSKPLFINGVVTYAPFYPEYPKLKVSKPGGRRRIRAARRRGTRATRSRS